MSCHGNFKNFDISEDEWMSDGLKFQHVKVKAGNLSNMIEKQYFSPSGSKHVQAGGNKIQM